MWPSCGLPRTANPGWVGRAPLSIVHRARRAAGWLRADGVILSGIVLVAAANGLLWLFSIPFNEAPDEAAHFQVIRFILHHGRLPLFRPDELWLIRSPVGAVETYAAYPPLAYIVMALLSAPLPSEMWGARSLSLASYLGYVALTFLTARRVLPDRRSIAVCAALGVAFLPQWAFTGAYANNDALGALEAALLFYLLVIGWRRGLRPWLLLGVGAMVGALLITKYTFYAAGLVGATAALLAVLRQPAERWRRAALLLAGIALVSGWWFARNWLLYQEVIPGRVITDAKALAGGNTLFVPANHGINLLTLSTQTNFWELTLKSLVASFGFMDIFLHPAYYFACVGLALLALAGLATRAARGFSPGGTWVAAVTAGAVVGGTVLSAMAISAYGEYSPQGRYLFAALLPTAIALAAGWVWLSATTIYLRWVPAAAILGLVALNFVSLFGYVVPKYFGPGTVWLSVQIDRPSTPQPSTSLVEVMGWAFANGGGRWRPYTPEVVIRYRRPVAEVAVYVDGPPEVGTFYGLARYGLPRPDVDDTYGDTDGLERVGYRLVLPPGLLTPGTHRIFACASDRRAREPNCSNRPLEVV